MENEALANGDAVPATLAPSPPARLNDHLSDSLRLEHQLMKVPFEHLKKSMRTSNRTVEKEMNAVMSGVADAAQKDMSKEEAVQHLTSLVSRLQGLKRKVMTLPLIILNFLWHCMFDFSPSFVYTLFLVLFSLATWDQNKEMSTGILNRTLPFSLYYKIINIKWNMMIEMDSPSISGQ
jgi:hypothetical protein